MKLTTLTQIAIVEITRNKLRSILTTLGVVIGVLSVILLTSIGNGLTVFIEKQFQNLGSNLLIVSPGDIVTEDGGFSQEQLALSLAGSKLSLRDLDSLSRLGYPIDEAIPVIEGSVEMRARGSKMNGISIGTSKTYQNLRNTYAESGRFFSDSDVSARRKVAVVGPTVVEKLFPGEDPLGQNVTINRINFEIIGVVEEKSDGGFGGPDLDSAVYIPHTTATSILNQDKITYLLVQVADKDSIELGKSKVEEAMLKRLNDEDFSITDQSEILATIQTILSTLTFGLAGIAAISLIVGGIGIMNIMLVAVSERTREIGLRKALGATPRHILTQFLIESAVLSTFGGLIGILLGIGGAYIIRNFFPASPDFSSIALAFSVSLATGLLFGVYPARRAASLSPIEALRYE